MSETNPGSGRVVVGVDGSAGSVAALHFAFNEAKRRGTGLLVVSAFELPNLWSLTSGLPASCTPEQLQRSVLHNTRRVVTEALDDRISAEDAPDVEITVWQGGAARVLVSAAAGSALLVVGSRGLGGFRGMLLGSVSLTCVLHAPCPVTVVPSADDQNHAADSELPGGPAAIR